MAAISTPRAAYLVVEAFWTWYRRNWRSSVVSSILQPLLFLIALGFGFGSQVTPGEATLGLRYVEYLAPALLVSSLVQTAAFESTYPVLSAFKWQRTYHAVASTPITSGQIVTGVLSWIAVRLAFAGTVYLVIAAALGAITSFGAVLSLFAGVLTAMAFASVVVAYSATIEGEGQQFNAIFRFVVMPMTMFAGTFFPVSQLPEWTWPLIWATPMWHGTELARAGTFGGMESWVVLGHVAYLAGLLAVGTYLCLRNFGRRLAV